MCNASDEDQPVSHGIFTPEMTNATPHANAEAFQAEQEASSLFHEARSDATAAVRPEVRERVNTIPVEIEVVIGRAKISVAELMRADPGYSFRLDKRFGEPVELLVNGRLFGYGEIVSDKYENVIGIRMTRVAR